MALMIRVVLCAHNGVRFLEAQLASIMDQIHPVDVVHVFDFASDDGTRLLLENLASRWPKMDLRMVDNAPGAALSFFHAFAQIVPECGDDDVIFLSDQDDIWLPEKTAKMLNCLLLARAQGDNLALAFHDVDICDETLRSIRQGFYEGRPFRLPRDIERSRLFIANPVIGHTIALTKPLLDLALRCLRPSYYVMHDWALVLLAAHAGRIIFLPQRLGLYRQHETNVLGAGGRRSLGGKVRRALELSKGINLQTSAFSEDFRCVAREAEMINPPSILPGRGPLAWRLGMAMVRRSPTVGHKLAAILQIPYLIRSATSRAER